MHGLEVNFVFCKKSIAHQRCSGTLWHIPQSQPRKFLWNELRNETVKEEPSGRTRVNCLGNTGLKVCSLFKGSRNLSRSILHVSFESLSAKKQEVQKKHGHRPQRPWYLLISVCAETRQKHSWTHSSQTLLPSNLCLTEHVRKKPSWPC